MKTITLTKGYQAIIDDEDFERVSQIKWYAQVTRKYVYGAHRWSKSKGGKLLYLHRFILRLESNDFIDHINHNTLDCRKENLRVCNNRQNQWNGITPKKRSAKFSKYRGVTFEGGKWRVRIRVGKIKKSLGSFDSEIAAAQAYNAEAKIVHGEFANLNQI